MGYKLGETAKLQREEDRVKRFSERKKAAGMSQRLPRVWTRAYLEAGQWEGVRAGGAEALMSTGAARASHPAAHSRGF